MKKLKNIMLILLTPGFFPGNLQCQMRTGFEEADLSGWKQYPAGRWEASAIEPITGQYSLHHTFDNTLAGEDRISCSLQGLSVDTQTVTWFFRLRHGYNPSSSNRWGVYLGADADAEQMHPGGAVNGYLLGVNCSGGTDDLLRLWKVSGGSNTELLNTHVNWESGVGILHAATIKVTRTPSGEWTVYLDRSGGTDSLLNLGSAMGSEFRNLRYFGLYYNYTATKDMLLWLDDLSVDGLFVKDTVPPLVKKISVLTDSSIAVTFSEEVVLTAELAKEGFFIPAGSVHPDSAVIARQDSVVLFFPLKFPSALSFSLGAQGITDASGNVMLPASLPCFYYRVKLNDVCFSEIMFDPSPAVSLPEYEYLELYNRTPYDIDLAGWTLVAGNESKKFPGCLLRGYGYLLLCQGQAASKFSRYGAVLGLFTSSTFLTNSGECLLLKDGSSQVIAQVCYTPDWYGDDLKTEGGWSIENLDLDHPCSGAESWAATMNPAGGTPGKQNSVCHASTDQEPPLILSVFPVSESVLRITSSEPVCVSGKIPLGSLQVDHSIGVSLHDSVASPAFNEIISAFNGIFVPDTMYQLKLRGNIPDCSGNYAERGSWYFAMPVPVDSLAIIFNEIMYQPLAGCPEWIELYNRSGHCFDLSGLELAIRGKDGMSIQSLTSLAAKGRLFFPGDYVVLTGNAKLLGECLPAAASGQIIEVSGMPALSDEGARLALLTKGLQVIDECAYDPGMQFDLLAGTQGISLERIDCNRPSLDRTNWHSAAAGCGYSTPGKLNSQQSQAGDGPGALLVEPEVFSPDNDGTNDVVNILYRFDRAGWVANITVYNARGMFVRTLAGNVLMGGSGVYSWDGRDDAGQLAAPGIYIILLEAFHSSGGKVAHRKVCVLSGA